VSEQILISIGLIDFMPTARPRLCISTQAHVNQSIKIFNKLNSCQTATEHIHMNCTNKNNDKMQ